MSQAYSKVPSEIYEVKGAAGLFFDKAICIFGQHVEQEMQSASQDSISPGFARSAQMRAFARCMGDDMSTSNVGFADPFADGVPVSNDGMNPEGDILMSGY